MKSMFFSNTRWTQLLVPLEILMSKISLKYIPIHIYNFEHSRVIMIQDFILFVTYTIIQSITSSEMLVRSAPWTVQLYGIQTQRIYINIKK